MKTPDFAQLFVRGHKNLELLAGLPQPPVPLWSLSQSASAPNSPPANLLHAPRDSLNESSDSKALQCENLGFSPPAEFSQFLMSHKNLLKFHPKHPSSLVPDASIQNMKSKPMHFSPDHYQPSQMNEATPLITNFLACGVWKVLMYSVAFID